MVLNQFGLKDEDLSYIINILSKDPSVESVIIFGSRAIGNYKKASDIDIAIKSASSTVSRFITRSKDVLENESALPYFFDIIHYETIDNPDLIKHIDDYGVEIYKNLSKD